MNLPDLPPASRGRLSLSANDAVEIAGYCQPKRVVSRPQGGAPRWRQDNDMPTPIPFADDGGTPACRAHLQTAAPSRTTLPDLALPARRCRAAAPAGVLGSGVLAGLDVLPGCYGNAGRIIALAGIAALAALIRRHTGMALGAALTLVALVGLAGLAAGLYSRWWRWRWWRVGDGIGGLNSALPAIRTHSGRL